MKLILFTLLSASSYFAFSQTLRYKIIIDEPDKIKNFTLHIDPGYVEAWGAVKTIGFGLRADVLITKRLSANLFFRKAYYEIDASTDLNEGLPLPKNGFSKPIYIEPNVSFHLVDKLKKKSVRVLIKGSTINPSDKNTYTKYTYIPCNVRKIIGLHGGMFFAKSEIELKQGDAINNWKAQNGNESFVFGYSGKSIHGSRIYNGYSQMRQTTLFGGFTLKSITNLKIDIEGYGNKNGNFGFIDFYCDFMYAPILSYQDIKMADGTIFSLQNISNKRTGWRTGVLLKRSNQTYVSYGFEFGQRPGYLENTQGIFSSTRSFANLFIGISLPHNFKFSKS